MTELTPAQVTLLSAAAAHPDGVVERVPGTHMTEAALARRHLISAYDKDGEIGALAITDAGRAALAALAPPSEGAARPGEASAPPGNAASADADGASALAAEPGGKLGALLALLRRPEGASLADLQAATGWQAHSVRGAISGAIKRKLKLEVTSEKTNAGRVYRVVDEAAA